jgi:hypothetical protein
MVLAVVLYLALLGGSFFGVFWGLLRVRDGFDRYAEYNALKDVPVTKLDSLAYGRVTVEGRVEPLDGTVRAPIGAEDCVLYDLTVEDWSESTHTTLFERRESEPFAVVTDEGRVRVDPSVALDLTEERSLDREVESHEGRPPAILAFDRVNGIEERTAGHERRYRQDHLRPGDEVVAYGRAVRDETHGDGPKPTLLTAGEGPFFLSNRSRAELLSARRWALLKSTVLGSLAATVSLAAFLWFSGIAQLFLGASAL